MTIRRNVLLAATGFAFSWPGTHAQSWPDKPIRLVVAYPAGGGLDLVARTLALRLTSVLHQQVLVDNKGGASGAIGADLVAKAAPDGYTLLLSSPAEVVVGPAAGQKTPYNPASDFAPIALVGEAPLVLVAHPSVPATNIKEFIAYGRANPGKLSYGTPGTGSSMHFAGESLNASTQAHLMHVPYRGAAPAINDALGNQVSAAIVGMPPIVAHVKAGKLKALAVTTAKRSSVMPDVPAVAELPGLSGYRFTNWMAMFAPAKTPAAVIARLSAEVISICQEDATRAKLAEAGVDALGLAGREFSEFLASERSRYETIARERSIRFSE